MFRDADDPEAEPSDARSRRQASLLALNDYSVALTEVSSSEDLLATMAERLRELTDGFAVAISLYDPAGECLVVRHTTLTEAERSTILRLLGRRLEGLRIPVSRASYERMTSEVVADVDSLGDATFGSISMLVSRAVERAFGIAWFVGVALLHRGEVLGTVMVAGRSGAPRPDVEALRAYAGVSANALRRWLVEREHATSEQRIRFLAETVRDVLWQLDLELRFTYVSPAVEGLLGYRPDEVVGRSLFELLAPESRELVRRQWAERAPRRAAGERLPGSVVELQQLHRDGSLVTTEVHTTPSYDAQGAHSGFIGTTRDVSERKRAEQEKQELQEQLNHAMRLEALGRLAGGVAHDFNNLLMGVLGNLELVLEQTDATDPRHGSLADARHAAQNAAALTQQLLTFSRKQVTQPTIVDPNVVLTRLQGMFARLIGEDVRVHLVLTPAVGSVLVDPNALEQVLANLVVNARDAMPRGGELTLATAVVTADEAFRRRFPAAERATYVEIRVSDTGVGMDEATRLRLFEPFFTTKPLGQGTGLGLATSYGVVRQAHGFIDVQSAPAAGTTLRVFLPRHDGAPDTVSPPRVGSEPPSARSTTILLVEDEPVVRVVTTRMLARLGYRVLAAEGPAAAIELVRDADTSIDVLLTDVLMPDMNGRELAARVTELRPSIRVLFASGYSAETLFERWQPSEQAFIAKPFTTQALREAIERVLREPAS